MRKDLSLTDKGVHLLVFAQESLNNLLHILLLLSIFIFIYIRGWGKEGEGESFGFLVIIKFDVESGSFIDCPPYFSYFWKIRHKT